MTARLRGMGQKKYSQGFKVACHPTVLEEPLKWKEPSTIFVCSMSDLFHELVPQEFVDRVMQTIWQTPQHTFQILTKRALRMYQYFHNIDIPGNVWLGTTVEKRSEQYRVDWLRDLDCQVRFLSCEPLLGGLDLDLQCIDWVIVGGESGPQARPMKPMWVRDIKKQCEEQNVAFFFKQWGTYGPDGVKRNKYDNGKTLDGEIIQQMPQLKQKNGGQHL